MKELTTPGREPIEAVDQTQKKQTERLVARHYPHRGHTMFEFDMKTGKMEPAVFESQDVEFDPKWTKEKSLGCKKKLVIKKDCLYISALNEKNARKHLAKMSNGSRI